MKIWCLYDQENIIATNWRCKKESFDFSIETAIYSNLAKNFDDVSRDIA